MAVSKRRSPSGISLPVVLSLLVIGVGVSFVGAWFIRGRLGTTTSSSSPSIFRSQDNASPEVLGTVDLNQDFVFDAYNAVGDYATLYLTLVRVEKVSQLTVSGKPYPVSEGEVFLSLQFELQNQGVEPVTPKLINYVRLVGEQDRLFAPGFFNAKVVVPGESTVFDSMAFSVLKDQNNFTLRVGEVGSEDYELIEVSFEG